MMMSKYHRHHLNRQMIKTLATSFFAFWREWNTAPNTYVFVSVFSSSNLLSRKQASTIVPPQRTQYYQMSRDISKCDVIVATEYISIEKYLLIYLNDLSDEGHVKWHETKQKKARTKHFLIIFPFPKMCFFFICLCKTLPQIVFLL